MIKDIVLINPGQLGYRAGYYYYAKYLSLKPNYKIYFICLDQGLPRMDLKGVETIYIKDTRNRFIRYFKWLSSVYKLIKKNKNHKTVFIMVYFRLCFLYSLFFPNRRIILDIRSGSLIKNYICNRLQNLMFKITSDLFGETMILSNELRDLIGINKERCHYLPLGAEILSFNDKVFDSLNLLYIGTLDGRNIFETVYGLRLFITKYSIDNIRYDIIGTGSNESVKILLNSIKDNKLDEIVFYHGQKNHNELIPFLDRSNIGVSYIPLTTYYDLQPPTKTFEYILSGLACVATNTYENKKLITSQNGVLCEDNPNSFAESLRIIQMNKETYKSHLIRESLIKYTWENIIDNYLTPIINNSI